MQSEAILTNPISKSTKMKVELRGVKYAAFASQETACFSATILIDGKKAGTARNDGHGGQTFIEPRACSERLEAYAKTLPPIGRDLPGHDGPSKKWMLQPTADSIVDDLVEAYLSEREDKRLLKLLDTHAMFTRAGSPLVFQAKLTPEQLAAALKDPAKLLAHFKADKLLNVLPKAEALATIKAGARPR